jgi:hypothetical protein
MSLVIKNEDNVLLDAFINGRDRLSVTIQDGGERSLVYEFDEQKDVLVFIEKLKDAVKELNEG